MTNILIYFTIQMHNTFTMKGPVTGVRLDGRYKKISS